jgi:hypothetical protein
MLKRYISLDIDGVLNYYPDCWLEFLMLETGTRYKTKENAKVDLGIEKYKFYKDKYRKSNFKANLPARKEWFLVADEFVKLGFEIIVSTSRPILSDKYPLLFKLTDNWLKNNGLNYKHLLFKDELLTHHFNVKENILFHVDDEIKYARAFFNNEIDSFLFTSNQHKFEIVEDIKVLTSAPQILNHYESIF